MRVRTSTGTQDLTYAIQGHVRARSQPPHANITQPDPPEPSQNFASSRRDTWIFQSRLKPIIELETWHKNIYNMPAWF